MSLGTNGTGRVVEHLTRSTAEMSPHERSAQADTMRRKLVELAAAHNRLVELVDQHSQAIGEQHACCQERWDAQAQTNKLAGVRVSMFTSKPFWQRMRWLVLGR